jgi:hypothetical protein
MRTLSNPSTAKCTLEHYTAFLLAEPQSEGCIRLAEVAGSAFAHDAANRFLNREDFRGRVRQGPEKRSVNVLAVASGLQAVGATISRTKISSRTSNRSMLAGCWTKGCLSNPTKA